MYQDFAYIYDEFMEEVPYIEWANNIIKILHSRGIKEGIIADLGCGTGTMTNIFAKAGFDMIGIDISYEMLNIAREKSLNEKLEVLYLNQDIREFELYGTCVAIISSCDSLNYIIEKKDLLKVFKLVNNYLDPNALFIFDMNTDYKYRNFLAEKTFAENTENASFIWKNYYDIEKKINEYELTFYQKRENDLYERFNESHFQRAYSIDEIKDLAIKSGMIIEDIYGMKDEEKILENYNEDSTRFLIVMKERGKEK